MGHGGSSPRPPARVPATSEVEQEKGGGQALVVEYLLERGLVTLASEDSREFVASRLEARLSRMVTKALSFVEKGDEERLA